MKNWTPEEVAGTLGLIIPILTALAVHSTAAAKVRSWVALVLAFIAGPVATAIQSNAALVSWVTARSAAAAFIVSLASYLGIYQPMTGKRFNAKVAPNVGIGKAA